MKRDSLRVRDLSGFTQVQALVQTALASEPPAAPGIALGVWRAKDPDALWIQSFGNARLAPAREALTPAHVFDLASVSKVVSTATLVATLVQRGWLQWNTPVRSLAPDFPHGPFGREVTLAHLLSHTAGFEAWHPYWERLRERAAHHGKAGLTEFPIALRQQWMREELRRHPPQVVAGERAVYSDLSFLWLGFILQDLLKQRLDRAAEQLVWDPMGVRLHYRPMDKKSVARGRASAAQYVATEDCPWRGEILQGQVHDDNTWAMGGIAGHSGVFGSAEEVLRFARGLSGGFLSREVLSAMWSRVAEPAGCERTLGWDTPSLSGSVAGSGFSTWTVGHLGFTGTSLWMDVHRGVAVALLTNRVHPTREGGSAERIRAFRPRVHDALWRDLHALGLE